MEKLKKTTDTTIKGIRNLLRLEKENKVIKDIIKNFLEHEEEEKFYKQIKVGIFRVRIILNIELKAIEKHYQLKNILIKLYLI